MTKDGSPDEDKGIRDKGVGFSHYVNPKKCSGGETDGSADDIHDCFAKIVKKKKANRSANIGKEDGLAHNSRVPKMTTEKVGYNDHSGQRISPQYARVPEKSGQGNSNQLGQPVLPQSARRLPEKSGQGNSSQSGQGIQAQFAQRLEMISVIALLALHILMDEFKYKSLKTCWNLHINVLLRLEKPSMKDLSPKDITGSQFQKKPKISILKNLRCVKKKKNIDGENGNDYDDDEDGEDSDEERVQIRVQINWVSSRFRFDSIRVLNVYGKRRRWRVKAAARSDVNGNMFVIEKSSGTGNGIGGSNLNGNRSCIVDIPVSCYQKYDTLFERNAEGSCYLQSKVHRAKECLETVYGHKDQESPGGEK
ncbi:hypothetical protein AgCh_035920 [Apium graveolens]